ncbi:MAG: hypothetical protein DWI29_02225 [Planctomycetota bacterium]|nr:MAG: hypothetical protein DWI29_02225 [Planctomycetota bacterium]
MVVGLMLLSAVIVSPRNIGTIQMKRSHGIILAAVAATSGLLTAAMAGRASEEGSKASQAATGAAGSNAERHAALIRTGESSVDWKWLVEEHDEDRDKTVDRSEFPGTAGDFARLDRTWDGVLTVEDFDWSTDGQLCQQKETTFALFKSVDTSSDGRVSTEEWQALFARIASEKGYLNEEELEELIYLPRVVKTQKEQLNFGSIASFLDDAKTNFNAELPKVGDSAPDFELRSADGLTTVRLSSFRGKKPVVLIFGCFSCGNYRTYSESLEEMYRRRKDDVEFLRVYVREAHPTDHTGPTSTNAKAGILIKQPVTLEDRCSVAGQCSAALNIQGPLVVDEIDNRVGRAWGGWPDRLYIIDRDGRVAYRGGPGPFGFNPREMEQSLVLLMEQEKGDLKSK